MSEIDIPQAEADALIKMEKHRAEETLCEYPMNGDSLIVPLVSPDKKESFLLDINRKGKAELKVTYQNRARQAIILLRLDLNGGGHRNPDGEELSCPHLHEYREGYADKWARAVSIDEFPNLSDIQKCLDDFMKFCNVTKVPRMQGGLFS